MKTSITETRTGESTGEGSGSERPSRSLGSMVTIGVAAAGISIGGVWALNKLVGGLRGPNTQTREFSRSLSEREDFSRVPTIEPSELRNRTWDSSYKPAITFKVEGVEALATEFQVIGDVKFSQAINLNGDPSNPSYNVYTIVGGEKGYSQPVLLIEPKNDVIALGGDTQARVHFVGEFAQGGRTRGGIWYGHSEAKAEGFFKNGEIIIAVNYIKVLGDLAKK